MTSLVSGKLELIWCKLYVDKLAIIYQWFYDKALLIVSRAITAFNGVIDFWHAKIQSTYWDVG